MNIYPAQENISILNNLNQEQVQIIWDALSQFQENQLGDEITGEEIENLVLDDLIDRLDSHMANFGR